MQKMIIGLILTILVLTSGCVGSRSEQIQKTEKIIPIGVVDTTVDIKNLTGSTPAIFSIKPNVGPLGTKIVITGKSFTARNNNIAFRLAPENSSTTFKVGFIVSITSNDSKTIEFLLQDGLDACAYLPEENTTCQAILLRLNPGIYPLYIVNRNGTSNSVNFTVVQKHKNEK